jgi:hypothetical protein
VTGQGARPFLRGLQQERRQIERQAERQLERMAADLHTEGRPIETAVRIKVRHVNTRTTTRVHLSGTAA